MSTTTKATPAVMAKKTKTPTWFQQVNQLAADPELGLAPLVDPGEPDLVDGRRQLHPYWVRRDVTSLLAWAEQLEEHPMFAHLSTPYPDWAPDVTRLSIYGVLLGEAVELVAETHLPVSSTPAESTTPSDGELPPAVRALATEGVWQPPAPAASPDRVAAWDAMFELAALEAVAAAAELTRLELTAEDLADPLTVGTPS